MLRSAIRNSKIGIRIAGTGVFVASLFTLLVASPVYAATDIAIGNGAQSVDGTYLNAQAIADNLVFTSIVLQSQGSITVTDPIDMSMSSFGTPHFNLTIAAPACNISYNVIMSAQGHLNLTCQTLNLNGKVTSGGSLIDPSRVSSSVTATNVLSNNADIQQAIDFTGGITLSPNPAPTILVNPGQYNENLTLNRRVRLTGDGGTNPSGAGPNAPTINGTQPGGNVITVNGNDITIDGLHLNGAVAVNQTGSVNGIVANNVDGLTTDHNTLDGFSGSGIDTGASTNVTQFANNIIPIPPAEINARVAGAQNYGDTFALYSWGYSLPSGVTISGIVHCASVDSGTPINSLLSVGAHTIDTASCSGLTVSDPVHYAINYTTLPGSFTVSAANQTVAFTSTAPSNATVGGTAYAPTATATSGLTPAITIDSVASNVCSFSSGQVTFQNTGTCVLDANQTGNANFNAALQTQQSFTVHPADQAVSFTSSAPSSAAVNGSSYTPSASATSGLPASITVDSAASTVCSINGGVVSFQNTGTCVLDANQTGNSNYNAAPQVQQSFMVKPSAITWSGFLQPINSDGSSIFKLGRTVPVKFQLTGASAGTTNLQAKLYVSKIDNNIDGTVAEAVSTAAADSGNTFRYDPTSQQYIFNLGTSSLTAGTYKLKIYVNGDNTTGILLGTVNVSIK